MQIQEIGGSPKEDYRTYDFTAQREFLVPWDHRHEFAQFVLGSPEVSQWDREILKYPGRDSSFATRLKLEPLDPQAIELDGVKDLQNDLPQYTGSYWKATVYYETIDNDDRNDLPETPEGTKTTYRLEIAAVEEEIPVSRWAWNDDPAIPVPENLYGVKRVPVTEHYVTWSYVRSPPWSAISQIQGKVNLTEFLGCAPGTLLFDGARGNKLYKTGDSVDDSPATFTWQLHYVFREKSIKSDNTIYGWNHFYRENPPGWIPLVRDQHFLYDCDEFRRLFSPEPSQDEEETGP